MLTAPTPTRSVPQWWTLVWAVVVLAVGLSVLPPYAAKVARAYAGVPTPGVGAAAHPLGTPPIEPRRPSGDGGYAFMQTQPDGVTPVAWDPCRAIHYVVRADGEPAGGRELLAAAAQRISVATGLQFIDDGRSTEQPVSERAAFQPQRYGDRWAPVLIAWQSEAENADFATDIVGQARAISVRSGRGPWVYVSGTMRLDAASLTAINQRDRDLALAVIEHEWGHLVGLAHTDDPTQLMYSRSSEQVTELGSGDRAGLARLGRGDCVPKV